MTPVFCCGFECGQLGSTGNHFAAGTALSIATAIKRSGERSIRANAAAQTTGTTMGITVSTQVVVARFYIYFTTLPTTNRVYPLFCGTGNYGGVSFEVSDSKIYARTNSVSGSTGFTVSTGQWYRVDMKLNTSANPWTCDIQIDGTAIGQASSATAAQTITQIRLFVSSANWTGDFYIDDLVISYTSADYPIGKGKVNHFVPVADGTHNIAGADDFERSNTGTDITNATTTAYQLVDDVPLDTGTSGDFINMVAPPNAGDYVECVFGPAPNISTPTQPPRAVEVIAAIAQASTATGNMEIRLNDNGTTDAVYSATGVAGVTTTNYKRKHYANAPTGPWSLSGNGNFNNLKVRFGSPAAVDALPDQFFGSIMIEAEFDEVTAVPKTQAIFM